MNEERWQKIEQLYHTALEREPGGRSAFLDEACQGDVELRREVGVLLVQEGSSPSLIGQPTQTIVGPGAQLGPYKIEELIGAGGMGQVFRAVDTRLGREVAIKVSAAQFSERFEREARAISALNHPNICTLHDVGPNYLVMELVEGAPLKGPLPLGKAVEYACQILDALDAAHRKGITHRDLKPANILIAKNGVKLLDFGLAHVARGENDPTLTVVGTVMGTPAYMAPEQWEGKPADARSDLYSFGCVLYEMLTGKRAAADRVPVAPPPLEVVLRTCLEKDPDERWQSARELKHALRWAAEGKPATSAPSRSRFGKAGWIVAGVFALIAATVSFLNFLKKPAETPVVRFTIAPPEKTSLPNGFPPALSPDGRRLVFTAQPAGGSLSLWVRSLDGTPPQPLAGTEGASLQSLPFWSPDGRSIGFGAGGKLKKIDLNGGPAVLLADAPLFRGASWSPQGVILFTPTRTSALMRIPATGGPPAPATVLNPARKERSHRWPWFLPDGKHFLYSAVDTDGEFVTSDSTIYAGSLDSREVRIVAQASSNAVYASGHLLFLRENALMAQPFDAKRLATTGEAVPIAQKVRDGPALALGFFAVSDNGTLVFQSGLQPSQRLAWLDRTGKRVAAVGDPGQLFFPFLSPDGKRAVVSVYDRAAHNNDLWIYDLARDLRTRFTFASGNENAGVWSPDGNSIVFNSSSAGHLDLYRKLASGAGEEELLYADERSKIPSSWSPDGKFILYTSSLGQMAGADLWVLPLARERKPFPFLKTAFNEGDGHFSPDGHWVAYESNESGRYEIYIAPFPGSGGRSQVSSAGGIQARWRSDGKELFYIAPDRWLMAAEIGVKGDKMVIGAPRRLFGPQPNPTVGYQYDVSPDGQRFLAILPNEQAAPPEPPTLVLNWTAGLKK
jgi:serine/threonine protein kinase/Tol biopolymer transport system component